MIGFSKKEMEVLAAVKQSEPHGWLPWRGVYGLSNKMRQEGLLKVAGFAAMPPHTLYCLSIKGASVLKNEGHDAV